MGSSFKDDADFLSSTLSHGLTQRDFARKPRTYRFEIRAVDPGIRVAARRVILNSGGDISAGKLDKDLIARVDLSINPTQYRLIEPTRIGVTQTIAGAWIDYYGYGLPKIVLQGTTGWKPKKFFPNSKSRYAEVATGFANRVARLKTLQGLIKKEDPTGLQDFVKLRNGIHRAYARIVEELNVDLSQKIQDQVQLCFYAWDTEDYFIVLIDSFELQRNASRPTLYDYNIQMTVIGTVINKQPLANELKQFYKPKNRLFAISSQFQRWKQVAENIIGLPKSWVEDVQIIAGQVDTLNQSIEDVLVGVVEVIAVPFTAMTDLSLAFRDLADSLLNFTEIPNKVKNDLHMQIVETLCAVESLKTYEKLFKESFDDLFSDAPWANLTCSSTMGIPPDPTSATPAVDLENQSRPVTDTDPTNLYLPNAPSKSLQQSTTGAFHLQEVDIQEGDTIETVILKNGGLPQDVAQVWQQIATINDLEYPYIVPDVNFQTQVFSVGTITIFGTPGTVIPSGTRVGTFDVTEDGSSIIYRTQAEVTIPAGGVISVAVTAENAGAFANVKALSIVGFFDETGASKTIAGVDHIENQSSTQDGRIYRVLKPGDKLKLPVTGDIRDTDPVVERSAINDENLFGNDLKLDESGDFVADGAGDLAVVKGLDNMSVAIRDHLLTARGELIKHPKYGFGIERVVGSGGDQIGIAVAKIELLSTILQDPRIRKVESLTLVRTEDILNAEMNIITIDEKSRLTRTTLPL